MITPPIHPDIILVCCSVFRPELDALCQAGRLTVAQRYFDSMLHVWPERLAERLKAVVEEELAQKRRVVLVVGDCCATMADMERRPHVTRVRCQNCYEAFLGPEDYRKLSRDGVFFLLPEWTRRWKEVFTVHLGFDPQMAKDIMGDMHRKLVFLDTGQGVVPEATLNDITDYCGLPWEVKPTSLACLEHGIQEAIARAQTGGVEP